MYWLNNRRVSGIEKYFLSERLSVINYNATSGKRPNKIKMPKETAKHFKLDWVSEHAHQAQ